MDFTGDLYNVFGVTGPLYLAIGALVALLLAGSLSAAVLEVSRVYREYAAGEPPTAEKKPELLPEKVEKIDITKLSHAAAKPPAKPLQPQPAPTARPAAKPAPPAAPPADVVKGTLPESMKVITAKYGLDWITMASSDGLVIASTSPTPDEDAAVYSNLFYELYRTRPEPYFNVSNKDIHLLLVESGGHKVIDVVRKAGPMTKDEAAGLREDSRKIVDRFVWSAKSQR